MCNNDKMLSKCNIIVISHAEFDGGGASSNHINRICRGLQMEGWNPGVVGSSISKRMKTREKFTQKWKIPYVNVVESIEKAPFFLVRFRSKIGKKLARKVFKLVEGGELKAVLLNAGSYYACKDVVKCCINNNIPTIAYPVEDPGINGYSIYSGECLDKQKYKHILMPQCSAIIGISSYWKKYASEIGKMSTVIPSYLPDELDNILPPDCTTFSKKHFHLVTLGRWTAREHSRTILKAVKLVHQEGIKIEYTSIGKMGRQIAEIKAKRMVSKDNVLRSCVKMTGWVDETQKERIMRSASAFALLRSDNRETAALFPTRLPEYLAHGRPVIVSKTGDIPLYLDNEKSTLFIPEGNRPEELRDAIIRLHENRELAKNIGRVGYEKAKSCFSIEGNGNAMSRFIEAVIEKKAHSTSGKVKKSC